MIPSREILGQEMDFGLIWMFQVSAGLPRGYSGKESACNAGDRDSIPGSEGSLEECMATHSSTPDWRIPWTQETGGLESIKSNS